MRKRTLVLVVCICILIAAVIGIFSVNQKGSDKKHSTVLKMNNVSANHGKASKVDNVSTNNGTVLKVNNVSVNHGTDISVDINLNNLDKNVISCCNFDLNYDKDILDVSKVLPGSIVKNSKENFEYDIEKNNGKIKFIYADGTDDGKESITQDGKFAKVIFKIKDKSKKGKTQISFTGDKKFCNKDLKKSMFRLKMGALKLNKPRGDLF